MVLFLLLFLRSLPGDKSDLASTSTLVYSRAHTPQVPRPGGGRTCGTPSDRIQHAALGSGHHLTTEARVKLGRRQRALRANIARAGAISTRALYRGERKALAGLVKAGLVREAGGKYEIVQPWDLPLETRALLRDPPDPDLLEDLRERSASRPKRPQIAERTGPPLLSLSVTEGAHAALLAMGPGEVRTLLGQVARVGIGTAGAVLDALPQPYADTIAAGSRKVYGIAIPPEWVNALKGKKLTGMTRDVVVAALGAGWQVAIRALERQDGN